MEFLERFELYLSEKILNKKKQVTNFRQKLLATIDISVQYAV